MNDNLNRWEPINVEKMITVLSNCCTSRDGVAGDVTRQANVEKNRESERGGHDSIAGYLVMKVSLRPLWQWGGGVGCPDMAIRLDSGRGGSHKPNVFRKIRVKVWRGGLELMDSDVVASGAVAETSTPATFPRRLKEERFFATIQATAIQREREIVLSGWDCQRDMAIYTNSGKENSI